MTQLLHRRMERAQSPEVKNLANMESSIRRIEVLVNDLLNISSIEMGVFSLHRQKCEMISFCRQLVDEYVMGTNPRPMVQFEFPAEAVEMELDVERIGQVIINLLSNARKYSSQGSPICLTLRRSADMASIAVQDFGVGIPPERLPHVFERFYRVPGIEVQTGSSVGFGLGLYISQQIVLQHGGHFEVESMLGHGSKFTIFLPFSPPHSHGHDTSDTAASSVQL
jgi:signal transduction histidine kinase